MKTKIFFKSSEKLSEIKKNSIDLVFLDTPLPGHFQYNKDPEQLGQVSEYEVYFKKIQRFYKNIYRVCKSSGIVILYSCGDLIIIKNKKVLETIPIAQHLVESLIDQGFIFKTEIILDRYTDRKFNDFVKIKKQNKQNLLISRLNKVFIFSKNPLKSGFDELRFYSSPFIRYKTDPKLFGSTILFRIANKIGLGRIKSKFFKRSVLTDVKKDNLPRPAPFNIGLLTNIIDGFATRENMVFLDPFLGYGTSIIACHKIRKFKRFYGYELDKKMKQEIGRNCQKYKINDVNYIKSSQK